MNTCEVLDCGTIVYKKDGLRHREDGPAVIWSDGTSFWYINDLLHREEGPAIRYFNEAQHWFINGKKHREGGPAVEYKDGETEWYKDGILHREDGPAIDGNEVKEWWVNGIRHRIDGPAIVYGQDIGGPNEYWINNVYCDHNKYIKTIYLVKKAHKKLINILRTKISNACYDTELMCKDVSILISKYVY